MDTAQVFLRLGVALALGLLVGMQRERASKTEAGVRTFAIVTLVGALAAAIAAQVGVWIIPAGLLCVTAVLLIGYWGVCE